MARTRSQNGQGFAHSAEHGILFLKNLHQPLGPTSRGLQGLLGPTKVNVRTVSGSQLRQWCDDPKVEQARQKLASASQDRLNDGDAETAQEAMESVLEAKRLLAKVRKENAKQIRQLDLDRSKEFFDGFVREFARPSEETAFDSLVRTAQRDIDRNSAGFETHLDEMRNKISEILWRQDWFLIHRFNEMAKSPHLFSDVSKHEELVQTGQRCLESDDIENLRAVMAALAAIQIYTSTETDMLDMANIVRG